MQELLPDDEVLVEFRQRDWLGEERREQTLDLLADAGLTYVTVDAPRVEGPNVAQTVVAHTTPTAYVRFHGRNAGTWNRQGRVASERFDHVYDTQELAPWVEALRALSRSCERVFAMFNTNNADQGPRNATICCASCSCRPTCRPPRRQGRPPAARNRCSELRPLGAQLLAPHEPQARPRLVHGADLRVHQAGRQDRPRAARPP